jgi:nucleotide-binding universal stress UspA family protein
MRILIALDESPASIRAAREAVRLFSPANAEFLVINVAEIPAPWVGTTGFGMVAPFTGDPTWGVEPDETSEDDLLARAEAAGVTHPEVIATAGDAVTLICAAAEEHDADVIVIGSHDKRALQRLFDPSVAAGVIRDTYRPVLVVSGTPPTNR